MAERIRRVEYFSTTVDDKPGQAYWLLARLKRLDVNLLGFSVYPFDPGTSRLVFFPSDPEELMRAARQVNVKLEGPKPAFLVQGEDKIGVLADVFKALYDGDINIHAVNCVCDDRGGYGFILWVPDGSYEAASEALGLYVK